MSHELRTPLNGIVGMINLMSSPISESEQKRYLDILKTTSLHLLHLVNNVLDYSKASAGKMELNPVPCSLDEIVRNLHSVFLPRFAEKKLDFLLSVDILLKTTVLADDVRMVQVLTNLLSNALKFTAAGRVTLEAHCLQKSSDRMVVECSVSDTGPGIAREEQVHLFDSFNNIQNKPRHAESTGLGLAISRMIVSEMGGMLQLESVKGKGSRFSIRITLPLVVEAPRPEVLLNSIPDAVSLTGIRVLIAEDNPVNMMIARTILKKWQIQTVEAVNGRIALDLLQEGAAPDLILLDLHMPEMNGYEAMERIREVHPDLPVIAFTASMLAAEERAELARLGFLDVVPKPFAPEELEAKMKAALARGTLVQA
jgi:CheY-like chemotaxis protein